MKYRKIIIKHSLHSVLVLGLFSIQFLSFLPSIHAQGTCDGLTGPDLRACSNALNACRRGGTIDEACRQQVQNRFAGTEEPRPPSTAGTGSNKINGVLQTVVNVLSVVMGLAATLSIIVGGIQYMTAGGNANQVSAAKQRITMTVLSLIVFAFGYALLQWLIPGGVFN